MRDIFYDGIADLPRIAVSAVVVYVVVILFIRASGKRSTSQMNNFDWILTVAMGSLLASGIMQSTVTLVELFLAVGLLLSLQYLVTRFLPKSRVLRAVVKPSPRLLFYHGRFLHKDMRDERISELEVMAAIRSAGICRLEDVGAIVLETDATLTVLPADEPLDLHSEVMEDVRVTTEGVRNG